MIIYDITGYHLEAWSWKAGNMIVVSAFNLEICVVRHGIPREMARDFLMT